MMTATAVAEVAAAARATAMEAEAEAAVCCGGGGCDVDRGCTREFSRAKAKKSFGSTYARKN